MTRSVVLRRHRDVLAARAPDQDAVLLEVDHCCTENKDPHVIEGVVNATSEALTSRATSFVPLAEVDDGEWWPAFVEPTDVGSADWADLVAFFDAKVRRNPRSGFISEMEPALALTLVDAIVAVSGRGHGMAGTVAIPSLTPSPGTQRWSPTTRAFSTP